MLDISSILHDHCFSGFDGMNSGIVNDLVFGIHYVDGHVLLLQMVVVKEERKRCKEKVSLKVAHVQKRDRERCILLCVCM